MRVQYLRIKNRPDGSNRVLFYHKSAGFHIAALFFYRFMIVYLITFKRCCVILIWIWKETEQSTSAQKKTAAAFETLKKACIALASRGWQRASKEAIKDGHAEHIHANCDCTYAVRFSHDLDVEGYNPSAYYKMYYGNGKGSSDDKIRALRRRIYAKNADEINAQKRSAYAKRQERESSAAEELNIGN